MVPQILPHLQRRHRSSAPRDLAPSEFLHVSDRRRDHQNSSTHLGPHDQRSRIRRMKWIPWRLMPTDLPPWPTVYRWFAAWRDRGLFETINHALVTADRERVGREASPSAAIIDSQSVKTTESGGPRRALAGKEGEGRQRHALAG